MPIADQQGRAHHVTVRLCTRGEGSAAGDESADRPSRSCSRYGGTASFRSAAVRASSTVHAVAVARWPHFASTQTVTGDWESIRVDEMSMHSLMLGPSVYARTGRSERSPLLSRCSRLDQLPIASDSTDGLSFSGFLDP